MTHDHLPTTRRDFHLEMPPKEVRGGEPPTEAELEEAGGITRRQYDLTVVDAAIDKVNDEITQYGIEHGPVPERVVVDSRIGEYLFVAMLVLKAEPDPITGVVSADDGEDLHVYGIPITVLPTDRETNLIEACGESHYDAKQLL